MDNHPHRKLDPAHFPNMSLQTAAILGFVFEREYTAPALAEVVSPDGWRPTVLSWPAEQEGVRHSMHLGAASDLRANLSRVGIAAGLDQEEWGQSAAMVRSRLAMVLGDLAGEDHR